MRRARWLALVIASGIGAAGWWWSAHRREAGTSSAVRGARLTAPIVPKGTRIRVQVLNATDARGLARQATFYLRDAGFDVVYFGNTSERAESTLVQDQSGHPEWAALAAKAMAPARVEQKPDSSHFLDLTVLVGRNWTPRQPLYP